MQYIIDTIAPVVDSIHLRDENYHYYLCLKHRYSPTCHPLYLSRDGYEKLKAEDGALQSAISIHTDSILNTLVKLGPNSLTVWVGMDQ